MKSWIHHQRGRVLRQAHVELDALDGLKEDELSRQGFSGRVAEFYRRNEPTAWTRIEGTIRPWDLDGFMLEPEDLHDPRGKPLRVFHNADVTISISRRSAPMPYYARSAEGDQVFFVHEGTGTFATEFGPIPYEPGDYIIIPKGVTYCIVPDDDRNYFLIIESVGEIEWYDFGPLGRHMPFDPALLFIPSPTDASPTKADTGQIEWEVQIRYDNETSSIFYPFDPFDVEGWKGDLFPTKLNIRDYRPIVSDRMHLMPSAHGIFQAPGFIICNFLPRPAEGEYEAERIPPFHRNIDCDEMMFVHGAKLHNSSMAPATMTLLPQGLHHGLPDSLAKQVRANWKKDDYYDQKLIAVDTTKPLRITEEAKCALRAVDQIRNAKLMDPDA
ncbi:homogentisate 1,2-dioxygenase [Sphingosinicella microcystinivorans]|uniref:homogentisate 1,2-dioxygenase n=1 Tax=Sphingosinicella microcystinivorans TaxID=335406 RepID=UPI0022F39AC6|nr:homogentisate 1,2-dioxygenase [Sphingosinicella microcystinivorans]WBX85211.1 homogentisate 1,2-dioxygenase [Sphingosinicella microcystinivorans]